jgi:predicted AAA+ superfamily ATPase
LHGFIFYKAKRVLTFFGCELFSYEIIFWKNPESNSGFFHIFAIMIKRNATKLLQELASYFKVVAVTGPRQSGKTTLVKRVFDRKPYVNLETPANLSFAFDDPIGFLQQYPDGAVIDEAQKAPHLFSYLQEIVDNRKEAGYFILTGSNNFLLNKNISQSLAGRVAYLQLLPFNYGEVQKLTSNFDDADFILNGYYPPVYDQQIPYHLWYPNYIKSYIERDVRQIKNITNLIYFEKFMQLLAGRTAQELNYSVISVELGVDQKTVQSWISVLEQSYIIFLLRPYHKNFKKTIVKRPKLYFYDTGIVCSLLGITTKENLNTHPLKGAIFETMVVSEFVKAQQYRSTPAKLYYWRDKTGREIDLIVEEQTNHFAVEIKSGKTILDRFFANLLYWKRLSGQEKSYVVYAGDQEQKRSSGIEILNWKHIGRLFET